MKFTIKDQKGKQDEGKIEFSTEITEKGNFILYANCQKILFISASDGYLYGYNKTGKVGLSLDEYKNGRLRIVN